ncbi:MAG: hypothetical protein V8R12_05495 [Bacteroides faecis]
MNDGEQISGGKIKRAGVLFNEYYGYVCDGIYQTQEEVNNSARTSTTVTVGDLKYRDISGPDGVPDGIISPEYDRVPLGNSLPRFQYGGTFNASYKGIDFSIAFQGIGKQNSYLSTAMVQPLRDNLGTCRQLSKVNIGVLLIQQKRICQPNIPAFRMYRKTITMLRLAFGCLTAHISV